MFGCAFYILSLRVVNFKTDNDWEKLPLHFIPPFCIDKQQWWFTYCFLSPYSGHFILLILYLCGVFSLENKSPAKIYLKVRKNLFLKGPVKGALQRTVNNKCISLQLRESAWLERSQGRKNSSTALSDLLVIRDGSLYANPVPKDQMCWTLVVLRPAANKRIELSLVEQDKGTSW